MILRDAKAIKLGTTTVNKIYSGTYKVYDKNKTALEGYCVQNGEPTPDNPIEIETMKGRQIINIKGTDYVVDLKSKNLLKVTAVSQTKNNIVFTVNADKTILANGKANSTTTLLLGEVYLEANQTYILNGCPSNGGSGKYRLDLKDSGGTVLAEDKGNGTSYTPTESGNYSIVLAYWYNYTLVNLLFKPMIRLSSIVDDIYEPYYDYELAGIGTYKDTIFTREGKWYKGNKVKRMLLDGSESGWENANTNLFNVANILPRHLTTQDINAIKTTYYYGGLTKDTNQKFLDSVLNYNYACGLHTNGTTIRFKDTRYTDKTQLQTWLASNNVILYYVLNTPTEEQITAPGLIAQLNALYQAI